MNYGKCIQCIIQKLMSNVCSTRRRTRDVVSQVKYATQTIIHDSEGLFNQMIFLIYYFSYFFWYNVDGNSSKCRMPANLCRSVFLTMTALFICLLYYTFLPCCSFPLSYLYLTILFWFPIHIICLSLGQWSVWLDSRDAH